MVNNFKQFLEILPVYPEGNLIYYCQIIKRKKDHPGLEGKNNSARLVKPYYFSCRSEMEKRMEEMISIAEVTGARIMMDCFPKDKSKVIYEMLDRMVQILKGNDDAKLHRLYNTCYGSMKPPKGRALWLIDWDYKDTSIIDKCIKEVNSSHAVNAKIEVVHKIPTKQGWHYIVKPFYMDLLLETFSKYDVEKPDIHKTSPSLVYIPKSISNE